MREGNVGAGGERTDGAMLELLCRRRRRSSLVFSAPVVTSSLLSEVASVFCRSDGKINKGRARRRTTRRRRKSCRIWKKFWKEREKIAKKIFWKQQEVSCCQCSLRSRLLCWYPSQTSIDLARLELFRRSAITRIEPPSSPDWEKGQFSCSWRSFVIPNPSIKRMIKDETLTTLTPYLPTTTTTTTSTATSSSIYWSSSSRSGQNSGVKNARDSVRRRVRRMLPADPGPVSAQGAGQTVAHCLRPVWAV